MTSRERLIKTLNHESPDRLVVDLGAGGQTGIGAVALHQLNQRILGKNAPLVKISEPYQMLGEVDELLRRKLHLDVAPVNGPGTLFGFRNENWKPITLPDGTPVQVAEKFIYTEDHEGAWLIYPQGDTSVPPSAKMPLKSYFFDALDRQKPFNEEELKAEDNCEEFAVLTQEEVDFYRKQAKGLYEKTEYGIYMTLPGMGFGDIALVPATFLKNPKGIRSVEEWYMSTLTRPDFIMKVFEKQAQIALKNIELLAEAVGDYVQVVFVSGTDFGMQNGLFTSLESYRELFQPFHKMVNDKIHQLTNWKTFIHTCGAIYDLIPDLIDAGFDILNPVQISATGMDPRRLKNEFGPHITFWGGGVDTQSTLPFGTPGEVYKEVLKNIEILAENGGYVFNTVHNIQSNVPIENILAMYRAVNHFRGIESDF
jgi:hypothetical protein